MTEHAPWRPYKPDPLAHLRGLRVQIRDWLWLRRVRQANADPGESIANYIVRKTTKDNEHRARLDAVWDAHEWGCDCTPDDPCRIAIALDGGPSRPAA